MKIYDYGKNNEVVELSKILTPFYIKNMEKAINMVSKLGSNNFLRSWFNKKISKNIMLDPEATAQQIVFFMKQELEKLDNNRIGIFVSHDWNIFPIKEFFFGLKHEESGPVGYLDSIFLFVKDNDYYLASHQKDAVKI